MIGVSWQDDVNNYDDPVVFLKRKGTPDDPYKHIIETVQVISGKANLTEVPDRMNKVKVTDSTHSIWFEVVDGELENNLFQVDYIQGNVLFASENNGKSLTFEYYGTGVYLTPDTRVYLTNSDDPTIQSLKDKLADIDRGILEQKNRVDTLITENPQPSEVVDMRIDRNGNIYNTSRDRINAEQKKIEDIQSEIINARQDVDGNIYDNLKDHFDHAENRIQVLENIENEFDFTKIEPMFFNELGLATGTVLQWFGIDHVTGNMYATQVHGKNSDGDEQFRISRMSPTGKFMDSMLIPFGGHGTTIGMEWDNGTFYIWSNWNNSLIRFPYVPNTTLSNSTSGLEAYDKFNSLYTTPTIDYINGFILFRITREDNSQYVELRKLSDVKNGVNNLLYQMDIPSGDVNNIMQGVASDGYYVYWYNGAANDYNNSFIIKYDIRTGQEVARVNCTFGKELDGTYRDNFREPEGIFIYVDPDTGKKSLFAGVVTGGVSKRVNKVYGFHQRGNDIKFNSIVEAGSQKYSLTSGDGMSIPIPEGTTKLSDILSPGFYYMLTSDTTSITDHPDPGDAGWWLHVYPSDSYRNIVQVLIRNSIDRSVKILTRVISVKDNKIGNWDWLHVYGKAERIPDNITKLSNFLKPGKYYLTTPVAKRLTDHPGAEDAGWWLEISDKSNGDTWFVYQKLIKCIEDSEMSVYERVVKQDGTVSKWWTYTMTSV